MSDARMAEFQAAAAELICERLFDKRGPRRFLLADEVGLGKTIVARGVLQAWQARRPGKPLTVVYLCSNTQIAEQNRDRLVRADGATKTSVATIKRVTQLALEQQDRAGLTLYSFTPGTSLSPGTGLKWERQLLLFLAYRVLGHDVRKGQWREYFRCGGHPDLWPSETTFRALRQQFHRKLSRQLQQRIGEAWQVPVDFEGETVVPASCLASEVAAFTLAASRRRNRLIGILRQGVQQALLDNLKPDLVVLDEVQRFRDVIKTSADKKSLAARLFDHGAAVLILSATPYKMLSLDHESDGEGSTPSSHYDEFLDTVRFLYAGQGGRVERELRADLAVFGQRLEAGDFLKAHDEQLRKRKARIERTLRKVIARTERNWYLDEHTKGIEEVLPEGGAFARPSAAELTDYVRLRRFLLDKVETSQHVTEYWKSCPAPFTFMDADYAPMAATRRQRPKPALPAGVVAHSRDFGALAQQSLRFRELYRTVFGEGSRNWRYLWTRPSFSYYRDEFFEASAPGAAEPRKVLVFSSWRFVPKAIALLASHEAEQRIAPRARLWDGTFRPSLRFTERGFSYVFDVCFPSPALASVIEPSALAGRGWTSRQVFTEARRILEERLREAGVAVGRTNRTPLWQVVARLDARASTDLAKMIRASSVYRGGEASERFRDHADAYLEWMRAPGQLQISRARLDHLAGVAAFSPSVSLLRAFWSVYPDLRGTLPDGWVDLCLESLRSYFNRRTVHTVIEQNTTRQLGYAQAVLQYCERAQFQAVADEYLYAIRHVVQPKSAEEAVRHLGRVFSIGVGTPAVNVTTRRGGLQSRTEPRRAHFALAFGDDARTDTAGPGEPSAQSRRTAVREAFNSPFWPFVLATTSAGQEGLDFHLYCQDIVHWNLPSNPVDLEQREGRINRRDGLAVRRSIAAEWPPERINTVMPSGHGNLWARAFQALEEEGTLRRAKHGLFPHWVFDPASGPPPRIRRHLYFYDESNDARRYRELKERLALYRLVFGQPRQQDLLDRIQRGLSTGEDLAAQHAALTRYMINLSPMNGRHAKERARREADRIHDNPGQLARLLDDVADLRRTRSAELADISTELDALVNLVYRHGQGKAGSLQMVKTAVTALAYLCDPFDALYDQHAHLGLSDDIQLIRQAAKACRS